MAAATCARSARPKRLPGPQPRQASAGDHLLHGGRAGRWRWRGVAARSRRASAPAAGRPVTEQLHLAAEDLREPSMPRTRVDLPEPLGPSSATTSPGSTTRSMPLITARRSYPIDAPRKRTSGGPNMRMILIHTTAAVNRPSLRSWRVQGACRSWARQIPDPPVFEECVGDEGAEHLGAVGARPVGEDRAEQAEVHADEPLGGLLDGDVGPERAPGRDAVEEATDERRASPHHRLGSAAQPGHGGGGALPLESLEPRLGPHRSAWRSRPSTTQSAGSPSSSSSASSRSAIAAEPPTSTSRTSSSLSATSR